MNPDRPPRGFPKTTTEIRSPASGSSSRLDLDAAWARIEAAGAVGKRPLGQFATPRGVALAMADALFDLDPAPAAIVDPACGTGALLVACAERAWVRGLRVPELIGFDCDREALRACGGALEAALPGGPAPRLETRDVLRRGFERPPGSAVIANPPWGIRVDRATAAAWAERAPAHERDELRGEISAYALFLAESLRGGGAAVFLTPIHWMHKRALGGLRRRLAAARRLRHLHLLRKGVFPAARDMIPVLSAWSATASPAPVRVARAGWDAPLPLPYPLPVDGEARWDAASWSELPHAIVPLLRSDERASDGDRLMGAPSVFSAPSQAEHARRWFHFGDGIYKTRLRGELVPADVSEPGGGGLAVITRASALRRYRLEAPRERIPAGCAASLLSATDLRRFAAPKLVLHAMKKANAPWRLCAALHRPDDAPGPAAALAFTNNFVVATADAYDGDLRYPLALLNSRTYNALYTDHFPGVNIEAYTLGALPFPWPAPQAIYERLLGLAQRLVDSGGADGDADAEVEELVAELLGLPAPWLDASPAPGPPRGVAATPIRRGRL